MAFLTRFRSWLQPDLFGSCLRDIDYGLRMLRRNPGFAALAVLTLGLGIGAATAVFTLVNAVLLRALPYRDPQQLVFLWQPNPHFPGVPLEAFGPFNADFYAWQQQSRSFAHLALFTNDRMNLSANGSAVRIDGSRVTGEFFQLLGTAPELGRTVGADDDQPGKGQVAVISHRLWQARFGFARDVLGKELLLDARPYRVVGVMPAGFAFPHGTESLDTVGKATDVWVPWAMTAKQKSSWEEGSGNAIGRIRPGVSLRQAQAEMSAIVARLDPLRLPPFRGAEAVVRPFDVSIAGSSRRALLIFLGAVVLVLLIACSNVASLVLARANGRTLEIGLRTALGASRLRLIRQLLAESMCLSAAGGILGVLAASVAIRILTRLNPAGIPRLDEVSIDWRVLLFSISVSVAAAGLCGVFPALSASRSDLNEVLKSSGNRTVKGPAGRLHRAFMVAEVALTFILLAGSGLLIRSFLRLQSVDKGFAPSSTLTMSIQLDARYNQRERHNAFFRDLIGRANALPGVEAAAAINYLPLGGGESVGTGLQVEGRPFDEKILFEDRSITPRYFAVMRIPLLSGRTFTDGDVAGSLPVAIVNHSFARRFFPWQDPVGKRCHFGDTWWTLVGVAGDVRHTSLEAAPPLQIYRPMWQSGSNSTSVAVRSRLAADSLASSMRALVRELDPAVAVDGVRTMSQLVSESTAERRFQTLLLTAFGGIALLLSLVGLYGLMTYSVAQRTAEIGIRMALGAQRSRVMRMILQQGAALAIAGIALGFAGAWILTRWMASLLFEVQPDDAATFGVVAILFCAIALAACYVPARRATRVDPMIALRYE